MYLQHVFIIMHHQAAPIKTHLCDLVYYMERKRKGENYSYMLDTVARQYQVTHADVLSGCSFNCQIEHTAALITNWGTPISPNGRLQSLRIFKFCGGSYLSEF